MKAKSDSTLLIIFSWALLLTWSITSLKGQQSNVWYIKPYKYDKLEGAPMYESNPLNSKRRIWIPSLKDSVQSKHINKIDVQTGFFSVVDIGKGKYIKVKLDTLIRHPQLSNTKYDEYESLYTYKIGDLYGLASDKRGKITNPISTREISKFLILDTDKPFAVNFYKYYEGGKVGIVDTMGERLVFPRFDRIYFDNETNMLFADYGIRTVEYRVYTKEQGLHLSKLSTRSIPKVFKINELEFKCTFLKIFEKIKSKDDSSTNPNKKEIHYQLVKDDVRYTVSFVSEKMVNNNLALEEFHKYYISNLGIDYPFYRTTERARKNEYNEFDMIYDKEISRHCVARAYYFLINGYGYAIRMETSYVNGLDARNAPYYARPDSFLDMIGTIRVNK